MDHVVALADDVAEVCCWQWQCCPLDHVTLADDDEGNNDVTEACCWPWQCRCCGSY